MAVSMRVNKSICLSVSIEEQDRQLIANNPNFRTYLLQLYIKYPEIFRARMDEDFGFDDCVVLSKSELFWCQI